MIEHVELLETVVVVDGGCSDCPFNYDHFKCKHPEAEGFQRTAFVGDAEYPPKSCPLRARPLRLVLQLPADGGVR